MGKGETTMSEGDAVTKLGMYEVACDAGALLNLAQHQDAAV